MARAQTSAILGPVWPIPAGRLRRVGESVMARRAGSGRPHKGVDLFAEAGSPVLSAAYGRVLRVVDGRTADPKKQEGLARAGLFVDVRALSGWVYRYLHLGSVVVREGEPVRAGQPLGTVSPSGSTPRDARTSRVIARATSPDPHAKGRTTAISPCATAASKTASNAAWRSRREAGRR